MKIQFKSHQLKLPNLLLFFLISGGILFALFHQSFDVALQAEDTQVSLLERYHSLLKNHFLAIWNPDYWLGDSYAPISADFNLLIFRFLNFPWSLNLLFSLNLFLGGIGMFLLLRNQGLVSFACLFGGAAWLLTNTVLTLVLPGHLNKVMTSAWIPYSLMTFLKALEGEKFVFYLFSGAFLGLGLLGGEVQVPYYLGLWYGAWTLIHLFRLIQTNEWGNFQRKLTRHFVGLLLVGLVALLVGFTTTLHSLNYLGTNSPVAGSEDPEKNWQFATQFYFPPEELLSYLATIQFFGGPHVYWGRNGNPTPLRLSDDYMGLLPLGFAILGGIVCWRIWKARLFIMMAVFSLLISFGREGGLYWLLYQLPTMKSQRNPHRWSYFVSLAVCVLAAYGVDWLWNQLRSTFDARRSTAHSTTSTNSSQKIQGSESTSPDWMKWKRALFQVGFVGFILFVVSSFLLINSKEVARSFYSPSQLQTPQGGFFLERARMLLASLTRTGLFLSLSAGAVWWLITSSLKAYRLKPKALAPWGAVLLVLLLDLGTNASRYICFYPWKERFEKHPIAELLRKDPDFYRVKAIGVQENPWLNDLVSNILPYHHISVVDPPAASRVPNDYALLFDYVNQHFVRADQYLDFFNVKYLLTLRTVSDPYVQWTPIAEWQGIRIFRRDHFMPRAWLATTAQVVTGGNEAVLEATFLPALDLRKTVALEEPPLVNLPGERSTTPDKENESSQKPSSVERPPLLGGRRTLIPHGFNDGGNLGKGGSSHAASCQIVLHEDNHIEMETASKAPSMLVLDEKWDPDWKAWLDGKPVKIYKANFLMRGVEVPPGNHRVRMEYRPSTLPFWVSSVSILIFCLVGFVSLLKSKTEVNSPTGSQ